MLGLRRIGGHQPFSRRRVTNRTPISVTTCAQVDNGPPIVPLNLAERPPLRPVDLPMATRADHELAIPAIKTHTTPKPASR